MTYNGWTNYETWLTNLHFEDFTDVFAEMVEEGQFDEMNDDEILDCCTDYLSDYIDDYLNSVCRISDNFIHDVIMSFVQEIDFKEIASHYVADIIADVAIRNKDKEAA
jgi:hypothetical protein